MTTWIAIKLNEGGPTMFWIRDTAIVALVVVGFHVYRARRWSLVTGGVLIALALACGLYGRHRTRALIDDGIARWDRERDAAEQAELRAAGYAEANIPLEFAAIVAGGLAVLLAAGELRKRLTARPAAS